MTTVIPKEFRDALEDARAQVNCFLNLFIFTVIILLTAIARLIISLYISSAWSTGRFAFGALEDEFFALFALTATFFGWLTYEFATEKIYDWGTLVKAAFDCYLPDLAKRLGYKLPLNGDDQRTFWLAISRRAIFNRLIKPEDWPRSGRLSSKYSAQQGSPISR